MEYYRYGKFRFGDYCSAWIAIFVLLVLGVIGLFLEVPFYIFVFATILSVFMLLSVIVPNSERFCINGDTINFKKNGRTQEINIQSKLTLIISYADICPPLAKHTSVGNQTYVLKNKYAISILEKMPLEVVLERLHKNYVRKYTNSTIEAFFDDYRYLYSFVCEQEQLDKLLQNKEHLLIIPESLSEIIFINNEMTNIYVDIGY